MDIRETVEKLVAAGASEDEIDVVIQAYGKEQGPKTTGLGSAAAGLGQAFFNLGDEAAAGAGAVYDYATGEGDLSSSYDRRLKEQRDYIKAAAKENPGWYYSGLIGGAVGMPMGVTGLAARAAPRVAAKLGDFASRGLAQRAALGAAEGAGYGAAYGAGGSEGGAQARIEGAVGGGAMGGALGAAAPAVISAGGAAGRAIKNQFDEYVAPVIRPQAEAVRRVASAVEADRAFGPQLTPGGAALRASGEAGEELIRADRGETTRALARSAANQSPTARATLDAAVSPRVDSQYGRVSSFLGRLTGTKGSSYKTREDLKIAANAINSANYRPLFERTRGQPITNEVIESFKDEDIFKQAMALAAKRAGARAKVEKMPPPSGKNDLMYWDYVKKQLDGIASTAYRNGDNDMGSLASNMAKQLRESLDNQIPAYGQARSAAQQFFKADDALEAGENFARGLQSFTVEEAEAAIKTMNKNEANLFMKGFVSKLDELMARKNDRSDLSTFLSKSPDMRRRVALAIGPQRAEQLEAFVNIEQVMQATQRALNGNSTTARQLAEIGLGSAAGGYAYGGNPMNNPVEFVTGMIVGGVGGKMLGNARIGQSQQMQNKIAELLVSKGDDAALMKAARAIAKNKQMSKNLREFVRRLSVGPSGVAAGAVGAQEAPLRVTVTGDDVAQAQGAR